MLARLKSAGLLWPTVLTVAGLAILLSLGTWQMSRKTWKDGLQARIEARATAEPVPFDRVMGLYTASMPEDPRSRIEYMRTTLQGRFLHDREQYIYAPDPKRGPGVQVVTPFEVTGAGAPLVVVVNRGYVPERFADPANRAAGQIAGATTVTGHVRFGAAKEWFAPPGDAKKKLWYWRDLDGIAAASLPAGVARLPFMIDAEAAVKPNIATTGGPSGGATAVKLPNRHLEYALTWYGLAATLAGVYLAYARSRLAAGKA